MYSMSASSHRFTAPHRELSLWGSDLWKPETHSVAIIKQRAWPKSSRMVRPFHWPIKNLPCPHAEACQLWQWQEWTSYMVHFVQTEAQNNGELLKNRSRRPMLRLQDRSFWDYPQGQAASMLTNRRKTIVSMSMQTVPSLLSIKTKHSLITL